MGSNTTYDIPVTIAGVNAASASLINDDADGRTFEFVSTVVSDRVDIYASADGTTFPPIVNTTPLLSLGGNTAPKTLTDRSLKYRAVFTGSGVRSLKVRAGTGCCAGGASEHFATLALGNFPAGGDVTTQANVDQFAAFTIAQTTPGQSLTFPAPSDPSATYVRWVSNVKADGTSAGLVQFDLYGLLVLPGASTKIVWSGASWVEGCVGTAIPTQTVLAAAGVDILDSDGQTTALGNLEIGVAGSSLQLASGSGGGQWAVDSTGVLQLSTVSGLLSLDTTGGGAIGIGAGATAKTITVGNVVGTTGVGIRTGSAGFGVTTGTAGPIAMSTDTTGSVTIDSGTTGAMNWGTGANAKTLTYGNTAGATKQVFLVGSGGIGMNTTTPDASALLDLSSTTRALLLPRMTTVQRDAIAAPAAGLLIYNTTTNKLNVRAAAAWEAVTSI